MKFSRMQIKGTVILTLIILAFALMRYALS